jgi:peptidoglycan/xylan/chitin deacetylase (PgdA/CDA1 family)
MKQFRWQMRTLARIADTVHLTDSENGSVSEKPKVSITFDDGISDTIARIMPVMKDLSLPFTVFVPSGLVGRKPTFYSRITHENRLDVVLSEEEIRTYGHDPLAAFGSHCVTHRRMSTLSPGEAEREIRDSKIHLEKITGREVFTISFPHGAYENIHVKMASDAGYRKIYTIEPKVQKSDNEMVVGRFPARPQDWKIEFYLKIHGAYRWLSFFNRHVNQTDS